MPGFGLVGAQKVVGTQQALDGIDGVKKSYFCLTEDKYNHPSVQQHDQMAVTIIYLVVH